jgi:hypothetical protein
VVADGVVTPSVSRLNKQSLPPQVVVIESPSQKSQLRRLGDFSIVTSACRVILIQILNVIIAAGGD